VLSWASSLLELAPTRHRVRSLALAPASPERIRVTCVSGGPAIPSRKRDPSHDAWVLAPRIRRHAQSIEPRAPPPGGDSSELRCSRHRARPSPAPAPSFRTRRRAVSPALPLGSAPRLPRPWRPEPPSLSRRFGHPTLDLGDADRESCQWVGLSTRPAISSRVSFLVEPARERGLAAAWVYPTLRDPLSRTPTGGSPRAGRSAPSRDRSREDRLANFGRPLFTLSVCPPGPVTFATG